MNFPSDLKYTEDHEWAKVEGNTVTIGITDHAQSALGEVVFVELPEADRTLGVKESFGVVESIKAVSDLYSPVSGKVIEVNESLNDTPSSINESPYDQGWIAKLELQNPEELDSLMDSKRYTEFVESLG